LQKLGIKYFEKFSAENIPEDIDLVIYSTAYNAENNYEFQEAQKRNLPMMSYPEILAEFFNQKYGIAVCGTHGKTTTSAMLGEILRGCGADPSAIVGGKVKDWDSNTLLGKGEFFVIEADEFQNKLKMYKPKVAILTSLDFDHPDTFENFEVYKRAFADFVSKIPKTGFLVAWGDSVDTLEVSKKANCEIITYGFNDDCNVKIIKYVLRVENGIPIQEFEVLFKNKNLGRFQIQLIGKHNVLNAAAVIATCHKLNLNEEKTKESLKDFQGTSRRFEFIGKSNLGALLFDDYGHHPEEIKATLKAVREVFRAKNDCYFHPHSYSRTEALLQEFAQSFDVADRVIVLDIYGSARECKGKISSRDLVDLINKYNRNKAEYIPTIAEVVENLSDKISDQDLVLSIGAGNGWEVLEKLKQNINITNMAKAKNIYNLTPDEILKKTKASMRGFSTEEANLRLKEFGRNEIKKKQNWKWLKLILGQFKDALIWILLVAALLAFCFMNTGT